ncbi:MAG: hypothetical protein ACO23H_17150 [Alphaproteobacteria bacterium]
MINDDDQRRLQAYFNNLSNRYYGKGKTVNIPFFGGFITLEMEFNNGMIDLVSAKSSVMGDVRDCDRYYSLGYTCPVGLARSTAAALKSLADEGMSFEAKAFHDAMPIFVRSDSV